MPPHTGPAGIPFIFLSHPFFFIFSLFFFFLSIPLPPLPFCQAREPRVRSRSGASRAPPCCPLPRTEPPGLTEPYKPLSPASDESARADTEGWRRLFPCCCRDESGPGGLRGAGGGTGQDSEVGLRWPSQGHPEPGMVFGVRVGANLISPTAASSQSSA